MIDRGMSRCVILMLFNCCDRSCLRVNVCGRVLDGEIEEIDLVGELRFV